MNLSSLPSPFGIGDFGRGGYQFVDLLCEMRMRWWQILPLCPIGKGNSPYSSVSAFALNPLYLDPCGLLEDIYRRRRWRKPFTEALLIRLITNGPPVQKRR